MKNKLDQFFKRKLQNRHFEFDDAYWQEMEQLLPQKKEKRKTGFWLLGLLILGMITTYWWLGQPSTSRTKPTRMVNTHTNLHTPNPTTQTAQNQAIAAKNKNLSDVSPSATKPNKYADQSSNQVLSQKKPSTKTLSTDHQKRTREARKTTDFVHQNSNFSETYGRTNQTNTTTKKPISKLSKTGNKLTQNAKTLPTLPPIHQATKEVQKHFGSLALLPLINNKLKYATPITPHVALLQKTRRWQYGIVIEWNFLSQQPTWKAGTTLSYQLNPFLAIGTEIKYVHQTGAYSEFHLRQDTSFQFGHEIINTELQPLSKHFIEVPLFLRVSLNQHSILAGLESKKLIGVKGRVNSYNANQLSPTSKILTETSKGWLPNKDFATLKTSFMLGYEYRLGGFAIGLRSHYLSDRLSSYKQDSEPFYKKPKASWSLSISTQLTHKTKTLKR